MGFYYFSLVGSFIVLLAGGALAGTFWLVWTKVAGQEFTGAVAAISLPIAILVPWSEELWIAWHFGQACKGAGTQIKRTVEVDGFYDDTRSTHAGLPTPQAVKSFEASGYRFFEMKGAEKYVRIEKVDDRWVARVLDQPTAQYRYKAQIHTPEAHKVVKHEYQILDSNSKEPVAFERKFGRYAPWFFVGLDSPMMTCAGTRAVRGSLPESVLRPRRDSLERPR